MRRIIEFGRIGDALLIRPNNTDACYYAPRPIICRENSIKLRQLRYCVPAFFAPSFIFVIIRETFREKVARNNFPSNFNELYSDELQQSPIFLPNVAFTFLSFFFFLSFTSVSNIFKIFFTACFVIMESKTCDVIFFSYYISFVFIVHFCEGIFHVSSGITYFILRGGIVKGEQKLRSAACPSPER